MKQPKGLMVVPRDGVAASELTEKQQRFVDEYLVDLNGTQAAIRAGYSPKTAHVIASENIRKPYLAAAILKRRDELDQLAELAAVYVRSRALRAAERLERLADIELDTVTDRRLQVAFQANVKLLEGAGVLKGHDGVTASGDRFQVTIILEQPHPTTIPGHAVARNSLG